MRPADTKTNRRDLLSFTDINLKNYLDIRRNKNFTVWKTKNRLATGETVCYVVNLYQLSEYAAFLQASYTLTNLKSILVDLNFIIASLEFTLVQRHLNIFTCTLVVVNGHF